MRRRGRVPVVARACSIGPIDRRVSRRPVRRTVSVSVADPIADRLAADRRVVVVAGDVERAPGGRADPFGRSAVPGDRFVRSDPVYRFARVGGAVSKNKIFYFLCAIKKDQPPVG